MNYKLLFISLFTIALFSCEHNSNCISGSGGIVTKTINISSFNGIELAGSHNIIITQGPNIEVTVTGHANIIDKLETTVLGGVWKSQLQEGCYNNYELTVFVTMPDLILLKLSGSGTYTINDFQNQNDLLAEITGSGNINFKEFAGCQKFNAKIIGSGNISGADDFGDLDNLNIEIIGSGNFNGFPIETDICDILIEGSGNCYVSVEDVLNVTISGSGNVYYKGYPVINANITGSGSIINSN